MRGDTLWDWEVESEKECIWGGAGRRGVREGHLERNPQGAQYHRRIPGGGGGCRAC